MHYKINIEELRCALSNLSLVSDIERDLIKEGLKQIFLGTGPVKIPIPGGDSYNTITISLENYLLENKIISSFPEQTTYKEGAKEIEAVISTVFNEVKELESKKQNTEKTLTWDYKGLVNNSTFFGTQRDWNSTLLHKINQLNRKYTKFNYEQGNIIITSFTVADIIKDSQYFSCGYDDDYCYNKDLKMEYLGKLGTRYKIFSDIDFPEDKIVITNSIFFNKKDLNSWTKIKISEITPENSIQILNLEE